MPDKTVDIDFNTHSDTSGAKEAQDAIKDLSQEVDNATDSGQKYVGGQREIIDNNKDVSDSSAEAALAIRQESESVENASDIREDAVDAVKEHIEVIDKSVEALENEAKAAQKANEQIEQIRSLQQAQLLSEFARGLGDISEIARDSGMEEFAEDLESTTKAAQVASTVVQGGLGISQLITQLGGMRASLASAIGFLTGPAGIALAASAAAFAALKFAVKQASDEMDAIARQAAKPSLFGEEGAKRSKKAVDDLTEAIAAQISKRDELLDSHDKELAKLKLITAEKLAQINADEAVALARVNSDEANDIISPDVATKRRANITESSDQARLAIGNQQLGAEVDIANKKAEAAAEARLKIEEKITSLKEKAKIPLVNLAENQEAFKKLNEEAQEYIKIIALANAGDPSRPIRDLVGLPSFNPVSRVAQENLNRVNTERDSLTDQNNARIELNGAELQGKIKSAERELEASKKSEQEAKEEAERVKLENESRRRQAEISQRAKSEVNETNARSTLSQRETARGIERAQAVKDDSESADVGFNKLADRAVKLAGKVNAPNQQRDALQLIVAKLEDGVNSSEAEEFGKLLSSLSTFITRQESDRRGNATRISRVRAELRKLSEQVSNNRDS